MNTVIMNVAGSDSIAAVQTMSFAKGVGELRLYDLESGAAVHTRRAPTNETVLTVAPAAAELLLAVQGRQHVVSLSDGAHSEIAGLHRNFTVYSAAFAMSETRFVASNSKQVGVWNRARRERVALHEENKKGRCEIAAAALSPTGDELAVAWNTTIVASKKMSSGIRIYELPTLRLLRSADTKTDLNESVDWNDLGLFVGTQQRLTQLDPGSLQVVKKVRVASLRAFAFDGSQVASGSSRGEKAELVNTATLERRAVFAGRKGHSHPARIALSPNGARLLSSRGAEVSVWDTETCTELWSADVAD